MINAEIFIARRSRQASAKSAPGIQKPSRTADLHRDLLFAIEHGWLLEPVLSHSRFAFAKNSVIGPPAGDLDQIDLWSRQYPNCNWQVETGRSSRLLIFSVHSETGRPSLPHLCGGEWDWCQTLQFGDNVTRFFAFRYLGQRTRFLGSSFEGIRIFTRESVLIPPSWFVSGPPLIWINHKKLLGVPRFLLHPDDDPDSSMIAAMRPRVSPNAGWDATDEPQYVLEECSF
jgi:hypothetical protein